jgi:predicted ATPase
MFLRRLRIKNYKSLKNVEFEPTPLSLLVGPNGAGKSNFASAVDFLSEVYRHGLELAIARKGGYENIAFRRQRRSRSPIAFEVTVDVPRREVRGQGVFHMDDWTLPDEFSCRLKHAFSFRAHSQAIGAEFGVETEAFEVTLVRHVEAGPASLAPLASFTRSEGGAVSSDIWPCDAVPDQIQRALEFDAAFFRNRSGTVSQQKLAFAPVVFVDTFDAFSRLLASCRVFQLAPHMSRSPGVPTPNPNLSVTGENLPAVVGWLKERYPDKWKQVVETMQEIVPDLQHIEIDYLHTKRLGLLFKEESTGRAWASDDVSDGTIRALAFLVALVDPRNTVLVIEELENSAHPWVIDTVIKRLRQVSEQKSVVVTTHSPVVVDAFRPDETWVVYKKAGESRLKNILQISPTIGAAWEKGEVTLSDYLDSGLIPHAVPGGDL